MTTKTGKIRILIFSLTLVLVAGMFQLALSAANAEEQVGVLTINGTVTVNGKPVTTGDLIASGSEIKTQKGSSAVVSLGPLGRVEALPSTTLKLIYDYNVTTHTLASIAMKLPAGGVKVSTGVGTGSFVDFYVEAGVTSIRASAKTGQYVFTAHSNCGQTSVAAEEGTVELRTGHSLKKVAEGSEDSVGLARSGCTP
jgi:hypothetical protein